ncbi:MAG: RNA 2'-phosphotransferase [Cellvibrionaceae bacterium]|nr:RNA 2'-phosphotransferase [Cellvibrionaceae bacterium]
MTATPDFLQDAKELLTEQGFTTSNIWYHGTSSALVDSIKSQGLNRSGDKQLNEAARKTMATIGDKTYSETVEPVFLTQSKELAYYWAQQTVRNRSVRIEGNEEPVVLAVTLSEDSNGSVKPDVGAASLLMLKEGEHYLATLAAIYEQNGLEAPAIDLMKADRMDYLNKLGMAYYDADIDASSIELIEG